MKRLTGWIVLIGLCMATRSAVADWNPLEVYCPCTGAASGWGDKFFVSLWVAGCLEEYKVSDNSLHDGYRWVWSRTFGELAHYLDGSSKQDWVPGPEGVTTPSVGPNGIVYVGANFGSAVAQEGCLIAVAHHDLDVKVLWVRTFSSWLRTCPAVSVDGSVYVGSQDGHMFAVDAATGTQKWAYPVPVTLGQSPLKEVYAAPAIDSGGNVYFGAGRYVFGVTPCGDTKSGWPFDIWGLNDQTSIYQSSPAIGVCGGSQQLYIGSNGGQNGGTLWALGLDGSHKWDRGVARTGVGGGGAVGSPIVDASGLVYAAASGTTSTPHSVVCAFSPSDGSLCKWTSWTEAASAVPAGMCISSDDGALYATFDGNGSYRVDTWFYDTIGSIDRISLYAYGSPLLTHGGYLVIGGVDLRCENVGRTLQSPADWPIAGANAQRTGQSYNILGSLVQALLADKVLSSPAIAPDGDTLYVAANNGNLYAVDPATGAIGANWPYAVGSTASSPAVAGDGTVYIGSDANGLYAINPDCTLKWRFTGAAGAIKSSPAIAADGTIYVGSDDHNLYAIDPSTGANVWDADLEATVRSSPAIGADGTIYVGSAAGVFWAVDADGTIKWRYPPIGSLPGAITASAAIGADHTIYFGCCQSASGADDSKFYALNPDGTLDWSVDVGASIESSAAVGPDGSIYFGCDDRYIYALNPDGTQKWRFATGWSVKSSPAVTGAAQVLVGSQDGNIYLLDAADGSVAGLMPTGGDVDGSPVITADGTAYIGSANMKFYGIGGLSAPAGTWPMFGVDAGRTRRVRPVHNWSRGVGYDTIQEAMDAASDGDEVVVSPGTYREHIYFKGPNSSNNGNITVRSIDPDDPAVVVATIVDGSALDGGPFMAAQGQTALFLPYQPVAAPTVASLAIACGMADNPGLACYTLPEGIFPSISGTVAVSTDSAGQSIITLNGRAISDSILVQMMIDSNPAAGVSSSNAAVGTGVGSLEEATAGPVVTFDGTETEEAILSGLTIQHGFNDSWPGAGGIHGAGTSATIRKCVIRDNTGTGIYQVNGRIDHCEISGNVATSYCGGGLSNCDGTIIGCKIIGNSTAGGGTGGGLGFCHGIIQDCLIADNTAPNLYDSEQNLLAYGAGGGIGGDRAAAIRNCTIVNNRASLGGGLYQFSAYTLTMENCILGDNIAWGQDGGYYGDQVCLVFTSYGFHVKYDDIYHAGWEPSLYSYIWNDPIEFLRIQSSPDIQSTNITEDPAFVDPDGADDDPDTWADNDYHLGANTLCIDAGDPYYDPDPEDEADADDKPRIVGTPPIIDMGAYEVQVQP